MSSIGLRRGTVKLVPYDPKWKELYEREKKVILKAIGNKIKNIVHNGSTAIPGISAKPIIDILIGVSSLKKAKQLIKPLQKIGYELMHDGTIKNRLFFAKGPDVKRTHYISIVDINSAEWSGNVAFGNYLRKHRNTAKEYDKLKHKLSKKYPDNRNAYTSAKEKFIASIIKKAIKKQ
jgi:GrpB-like predicted nucleotidyltransferase (UPF0157 family)